MIKLLNTDITDMMKGQNFHETLSAQIVFPGHDARL